MTAQSNAHALVHDLSTRLMAGPTATETLLAWCDERGLSHGPITVECQQQLAVSAIPDEVKIALKPALCEAVHYRQVQLMRGLLPLAVAENWFVPQRLTKNMNEVLDQTNTPFGTVVAPLQPSRRTLAANAWPPASDWVGKLSKLRGSTYQLHLDIILEHKAVILDGFGTALAIVKEGYFSKLASASSVPTACSSVKGCDREKLVLPAAEHHGRN